MRPEGQLPGDAAFSCSFLVDDAEPYFLHITFRGDRESGLSLYNPVWFNDLELEDKFMYPPLVLLFGTRESG